MYEYNAKVIRIVDGDTVVLDVDCGFNCHFQEKFRMARINAPELKTPEGALSKVNLIKMMPIGSNVVVKSSKRDAAIKEEKYGRWLAEIIIDGVNINDYMVDNNYAKKWI